MRPARARFAQRHADLSGTWDLTVTGATDAYTFSMVAEIVQQDTELTGTLDGPSGKRDLTGTVDGNQVTFSITIESPESAFTLTFTGTLEDDQLSGTMSAGEGQYRAPWVARRRASAMKSRPREWSGGAASRARAVRTTVGSALVLVALGLGSCAGQETPATETGMALIESDAPLWSDDAHWRLADAPAVSIGVDAGEEPYMFYRVRGVLRLPDGSILVSDAGAHEVRLFDREGVFVSASGRQGQGPGEYGEPASMTVFGPTPAGLILVTDSLSGRINVLDADGTYVTQLEPGRAPNASGGGVAGLFGDGSWFVRAVDGDNALRGDPGTIIRMRYQLLRFSDEGQSLGVLAYADSRPRYVNEVGGVTNFPYIPFTADGQAVASGARLWMTTGADPEVWAVDFQGNEVARVRWRIPDRRRSSDVYDRYVEGSLAGMTRERDLTMYGQLYKQDLPLPEYIPSHRDMIADEMGNLWLERYRLPWETQPSWDVVDPQRGWLGVVETPTSFQVMQITADELVGVHRDDEGVTRVQVLPLLK